MYKIWRKEKNMKKMNKKRKIMAILLAMALFVSSVCVPTFGNAYASSENVKKNKVIEKNVIEKENQNQHTESVAIDIRVPKAPDRPEKGATFGMVQTQQDVAEMDMKEIVKNILTPATLKPIKPEPATESEKETAKTEEAMSDAAMENKDLIVTVSTQLLDKNQVGDDADKIAAALDTNAEILQFADISISAQAVTKEDNFENLGKLRNIDKELSFTVLLPENTKGEEFGIARVHDGEGEIVPETEVYFDAGRKALTFPADRFSTYAVYKVKDGQEPDGPDIKPEKPTVPNMVKNVRVKTDHNLLKVLFSKSSENLDCYRIAIRETGKKWVYINTTNNSRMIYRLYKQPLVRNAKYEIKVAAVADKETNLRSEYSQVRTAYTNRIGNRYSVMPMPKFATIKITNGTARITAKKINYTALPKNIEYKVSYKIRGTKEWKFLKYTSNNVKTINGLKKGKTYNFALRYRYISPLDGKTYTYSKVAHKYSKIK